MTRPVLNRVVRRETHSPRTVATVVVLILVAASAIYVGIEIVLHLVHASPLLVAPGVALTWLTTAPDGQPPAVVAGGVVVAALGAFLLWLALAPGRLSKHRMSVSSYAVVADNEVIASAVAEEIRRYCDLSRDGVVVGISHRVADVTVRPEPGQEVDKNQVRSLAEEMLAEYGLSPKPTVRARVQQRAGAGGAW